MKKFDLHIHTIPTAADRTFEFSIKHLKNYVEINGLDAIAITNHNCFRLDQFRSIQDELGESVVVFPGIEINIGRNAGHIIVIADPLSAEDFSTRCLNVETEITGDNASISVAKLKEIFQNLSNYLLIPHYEKTPYVDKTIIEELKDYIICGEVSSVKKFIYCQKDEDSLTPVYFSDWRPVEGTCFPNRQTWIDTNDFNISTIKYALSDKTKVQLSDDGHQVFHALPEIKLSTGLTVIMGGRSSGKSYTLNRIFNSYENVKYIRQFSLLEIDPEKSREEFTKKIAAKQSTAMRDYFLQFSQVVDDVSKISLSKDEDAIDNYLTSLLKHASEVDRADMFSRCALYSESDYSIDNLDGLRNLISAVEKLLDARQYQDIIDQNISRSDIINLHANLINKYIDENQKTLKKTWVNDTVHNIKRKLQRRTANTRIEDVDFYSIQLHRKKVELFCQLARMIKRQSVIDEQDVEGFKIQVSKRPYARPGELKTQSGRIIAFSDVFDDYNLDSYKYLHGIAEKHEIEAKDYYQYFAKIEYKILNQYGYEVSGGERAEFNLLQEINDAYHYDMLLIDEPESSFDNIFLRDRVNHIIKDISSKMPVVIVTHNNTVGASIKPNYIVHTRREIVNREAVFEIYHGYPGSKMLESSSGKTIPNIDVTLDCLEAGKNAYEERRRDYEMLRN